MPPRLKTTINIEDAEIIALKALVFLSDDEARIGRFLAMTGLTSEDLHALAGEAGTLRAVLEHLANDEPLLLVFAAQTAIAPERIALALQVLSEG